MPMLLGSQLRGSAWEGVEFAQDNLNRAAERVPALAEPFAQFKEAWAAFSAVSGSSATAAVNWRTCAQAQQELNRQADESGLLPDEVRKLTEALAVYVKNGGSKDRLPGVGGLS